jgi:hypothetical protein
MVDPGLVFIDAPTSPQGQEFVVLTKLKYRETTKAQGGKDSKEPWWADNLALGVGLGFLALKLLGSSYWKENPLWIV